MRPVAVIGAGGFGREVLDILRDQSRTLLGVFDDSPALADLALLSQQKVSFLGSVQMMIEQFQPDEIEYVIGIGTGNVRKLIDNKLTPLGFEPATLVHSTSSQGFGVTFAPGTVICAGARLTTNISIGRHTHVNINSTIGHDSILQNYVTVNPLAAVSGSVHIGECVLVGAGAFIVQGKTIGDSGVVGAAAAVMKDVESNITVVGVPAKPLNRLI